MGCKSSKSVDASAHVKAEHKPAPDMSPKDAKELVEATKVEAAGVIAEKVTIQEKIVWKNARANKFFCELDKDGNGKLDDKELLELAKWSWNLMNPNDALKEGPLNEYMKDLKSKCDKDGDGVIDKTEF